ncbi:tRNA-splicing endonuclease subunit Sen2 isoform X1 [Glossina fuscipes]|uniref:tRNA-intron lyase n=1 Tax=Glossina fuscipes TaxID=7396 RepID=A0A8U0WLP5_9MUSC|nr:tRNA-splicing endonuclease subunit Sen2 isoform X1 [Glossina fuscipes]XP_037886009.1 tRNA-splicing endonuclease subunit Sen2 isoform X1 [Glossina fuscipes]
MFLSPNVKSKKGVNAKWHTTPFPTTEKELIGIFTGVSVEVCENADIIELYTNGNYGKGTKSRSTPQIMRSESVAQNLERIEETLALCLEEAFFLSYYLKVLRINNIQGERLEWFEMLQECEAINRKFVYNLAAYIYLKSKCWVVKSGLKFGANFLIYRKGPRFYHASFAVLISCNEGCAHLVAKNIKGLQRIAETSDKDILLLDVNKPSDFQMGSLEDISRLAISESVIRRFNYAAFVQNKAQKQ